MRQKLFWVIFIIIAIVFFLGSLVLSITGKNDVYISPDETANAFFARNFSETGSIRVQDQMNLQFNNELYPRSVVAKNGELLPKSFLGLPVIYGVIAFFAGNWVLAILTPLFAILAALAFRRLLSNFFSKTVSDLSALLFLIHPAIWYYSARALMHNVLFISLSVFAAYLFLCKPLSEHLKKCEKRFGKLRPFQKTIDSYAAGVLLGLSLFVRASEIFWIAACIILLCAFFARKANWKNVLRFFIGAVIGLLPFFYFNITTYGHPLVTGYTLPTVVQQSVSVTQSTNGIISLLPFGFSAQAVVNHFSSYAVMMFWWLSILAIIGITIVLAQQKNNHTLSRRVYILISIVTVTLLGIWYGSWTFFDNPDPSQITIANSYVRYWLPIYVLSIPFISETLIWISSRGHNRLARGIFLSALLVLIIGLNMRITFFEGQDSLTNAAHALNESRKIKHEVLNITQENSVIVVDRADKLFFPDRHVRYPFRSETTYDLLPKIAQKIPVYYYGITFPQGDIDYLNGSKLKKYDLKIEPIKTFGIETLYQIEIP